MYYLKNIEMDEPRSIYKAKGMGRFYRGTFTGLDGKVSGHEGIYLQVSQVH